VRVDVDCVHGLVVIPFVSLVRRTFDSGASRSRWRIHSMTKLATASHRFEVGVPFNKNRMCSGSQSTLPSRTIRMRRFTE
jgi:hypothetical protein